MNAVSPAPRRPVAALKRLRAVPPMAVVRYALVFLYMWFGTRQLLAPSSWTAFLPEMAAELPVTGETLVRLNGIFEVAAAGMLLVGGYARLSALLLGAHLAAIAASLGGPLGVRDGTLAIVTLAVAAAPPDALTLDDRLRARSAPSGTSA